MRSVQEVKLLLSQKGSEALQKAAELNPHEESYLNCFQTLSKHFPPDIARIALEAILLKTKALKSEKFLSPEKLLYTKTAIEQASHHLIAHYRAKRYSACEKILDLCCSIGNDTIAFAQVAPVIGIDHDPLRLYMASHNCAVWSSAAEIYIKEKPAFIQADLSCALPIKINAKWGIFFDPDRRSMGKRIHSTFSYLPPLSTISQWLPFTRKIGVKLSPAVSYQEIHPYLENNAELEFISIKGDLKEAVLWLNDFSTTSRRATLLPSGDTLEEKCPSPPLSVSEPKHYLYEPDPAVIRAGLIAKLGLAIEATQLDTDIAYLTSDKLSHTPFARVWQVMDWFPYQLKRLRSYLRERNIGSLTVKKRGSPWQPEALIKALRTKGDNPCTIFLTHCKGKPITIIAHPAL